MKKTDTPTPLSLLYPPDHARRLDALWDDKTKADLGLEEAITALSLGSKYVDTTRSVLYELTRDATVIKYRQDILADFLNDPGLVDGFAGIMPALGKLHEYSQVHSDKNPLQQTLGRLTELNTLVSCVNQLQTILSSATSIRSQGLNDLRFFLENMIQEDTFHSLLQNLPELLSRLNNVPSITIGVNLDNELQPIEATLLSVNDKPFKGAALLDRLMGKRKSKKADQGIGPLHELPYKMLGVQDRVVELPIRVDYMLVPLFKDLQQLLRSVILPINDALKQYSQVNAQILITLEQEVAFYLGAAALVQRLRSHKLAICFPGILPAPERACQVEGIYNLLLALRLADREPEKTIEGLIVSNNVDFSSQGRIFILTGPNQGGKTVFTQAVGLAQVLFQAGLFVPGNSAQVSPVDGVFTHFASAESMDPEMGRLGEESERLNWIFQNVTDQGLVLLNESLFSTSPGESLYLARDIVRALRLFGVRAIYATHLHELAEGLDALNAEDSGESKVVSLVAEAVLQDEKTGDADEVVTRTFKIVPNPPRGRSFAREIAARHGISFDQLTDLYKARQHPGKE